MFHVRDRGTGSLFDPWAYLGPKRRKLLDRSWAGLFRKEILPRLPIEAITAAFHARLGRPSKDAYTLMGVLVFQQIHDVTDEETVRQLAFNTEWHYALDLSGESDEGKYVCLRTLWTMRQLLAEKKLDQLLFDAVTTKLARVFSVDTSKQRLDSVHITSNMRRLGRIGIFVRVITGFLTNLKRREPELFATLDPSFSERYLSSKGQAVFSMVKPSESDRTLSQVTEDLFVLFRRFEKEEAVRLAVLLKAVGVNLFRATAFRKAKTERTGGGNGGCNGTGMAAGRLHAAFTGLLTILIVLFQGKTESVPWIAFSSQNQAA